MKKITLSLIAVLAVSFAFSQSIEIGVKAGANLSQVKSSVLNKNPEINTSLHGGAFALAKFSFIGVQPEIILSKQGSGSSADLNLDLLYLNIPVMVKLYIPMGLNVQVGPQFGVVVDKGNSDIKGKIAAGIDDITKKLSNNNFSVAFGAGWDAPFGLKIDARYLLGITDLTNDDALSKAVGEIKNNNFQISIGYTLFKLGN